MNLDDLDIDAPTNAPARVSRFAPKSSKFKPKLKPETLDSAATTSIDPLMRDDSEIPPPKPESLESEAGKKEKEDDDDVKPTKSENSTDNGFVKMEVDGETEPKDEPEDDNVSTEMGDFEDTVIREIDVFYNPKVDQETQLYVFQYPLRPCWRPYELDERCQEVRVRPGSSEVELDLSMDIDSNNYDQDCGSKMKMTKQTLHCAWKEPPVSGYAVGVLMGNKLHLNPIHAAVQLRPSLTHLSSGGLKRKNGGKVEDAEEIVKTEEPGGKKAAGPVKKQTKATNPVAEEKIPDGESWVPLKYQGSETELSSKYFKSMEAQESTPVQFTMSPFDYLNTLCPGSSNKDAKAKGPSNKSLLSLPLEERIKRYLCEGRVVHRFNALKYVAPDCTEEDLMDVLLRHAQLVQGLWVPKNSLLYTEPDKDGALRIARDYVLYSFRKSPNISFSSLHFPGSLKTSVNKFLNTFAVERPLMKDWKFKEPADNSFIKGYPDIVQKQEQIWDDVWGHIKSIFAEAKSGRAAKNAPLPSRQPQKQLNTGKAAIKGAPSQVVGKNIPDDIREVLSSKVLPKVIQDHKVCSFQRICQGLRDLALNKLNLPKADPRFVKAAEYGSDSPDELRKLADHIAINIHGLYVLKSSSEHPQYDSFRNVVVGLLQENGPNAKLKKAEIFDTAKKALNRDVTTNEYSKVMNEICTYKGSFWMLKSGDGNPK